MSQLKGKSLVNGGVVVFSDSESSEGGLWVNEVRDILAVTVPCGQEIGRRGWKRPEATSWKNLELHMQEGLHSGW